jgi:hypothetical protein
MAAPADQQPTPALSRRWIIGLLLVVVLSVFAVAPLLQPGFFWGAHDARHSVYFLVEFDQSVQDGIWYPRWSPDFAFGYGYPIFNIYGPLPYFVGEGFHLLGMGFVDATKLVFGLAIVASALTMFLFVRSIMGTPAAVIASLVYVYIPYRIVDIYVRGALAESLIFAFMPLALWSFRRCVLRPGRMAVVVAGLSYASLMLSNPAVTLLFSLLLAIYLAFLTVNRARDVAGNAGMKAWVIELWKAAWPSLLGIALGLGLSAICWIPLALEYQYVRVDQWTEGYYNYRSHFSYLFQLFSPRWGFGTSQPGPHDEMPLQLGAIPLILSILSIVAAVKSGDRQIRRQLLFFQGATLVCMLLMLPLSAGVWEVLRLVIFAQFPWRLLTLTTVSMAFLAGSVATVETDSKNKSLLYLTPLCALVIMGAYTYLSPQIVEPAEGPVSLAGLMRFQQSSGEMVGLTAWVKEKPTWSTLADLYIADEPITTKLDYTSLPPWKQLQIGSLEYSSVYEKLIFEATEESKITFFTFFYPGWHAYLLEEESEEVIKELPIAPQGKYGFMTVELPPGRYKLEMKFEDTLPRIAGQAISAAGVIAILAAIGWEVRSRRSRAS